MVKFGDFWESMIKTVSIKIRLVLKSEVSGNPIRIAQIRLGKFASVFKYESAGMANFIKGEVSNNLWLSIYQFAVLMGRCMQKLHQCQWTPEFLHLMINRASPSSPTIAHPELSFRLAKASVRSTESNTSSWSSLAIQAISMKKPGRSACWMSS